MNTIARRLGYRFFERGGHGRFELRLSWAEITGRLGLALALINWDEDGDWSLHVHLGWPNVYLKLPFLPRRQPKEQVMDQWGASWFDGTIHAHWGHRTKIVHMPWNWSHYRTSYLLRDGKTWVHEIRGVCSEPVGTRIDRGYLSLSEALPRWVEMHPYRYVLRSGVVQERKATIMVSEREARMRWFKRLPWPRKVSRSIDVAFDGEVGERTGSWKGGTVGCGYTLRRDETPLECLRRMQEERRF